VFKNAFSSGPWTVPSMYSIITGLYPSEHGMTTGQTVGNDVMGQRVLPEQAETLAEHLLKSGYTTFGVNTNFHMAPQFGFDQGFQHFYGEEFAFLPYPNLQLDSIVDQLHRSPKFFLWMHYFDPHFPYSAQPPWFGQWNDSKFRTLSDMCIELAELFYRFKRSLKESDPVEPYEVAGIYKLSSLLMGKPNFLFHHLSKARHVLNEDYTKLFRAAYKSNVRQTDEAMAEAFARLNIDDQTLLIVVADHGEEIFDHGELGHRKNSSLYQELVRVPLIIVLPGGKQGGRVISSPVSIIDIMPTILELTGQPVPPGLSGQSLVPLIRGKSLPRRYVFAEVSGFRGEARAVIDYPWKYIYNFRTFFGELYHLENDPGERHNLVTAESERVVDYHERLVDFVDTRKHRWSLDHVIPLGDEDIQRLRQMGYIN
jgi:arylsulfatase A-like enzyme